MAKRQKPKQREVTAPQFRVAQIEIQVIGQTALAMNRYSEQDLPDKDAPAEEWAEHSTHRDEEGNVVFPAPAFKGSIMAAARCFGKRINATGIKQNIQVLGHQTLIEFDKRTVFTTWVNHPPGSRGTPAMCHRPLFHGWRARLTVTYNPIVFTAQEVFDIFEAAGQTVGIGSGRPGSVGSGGIGLGMFHVMPAA